jgi:hypothetical protein
MIRSTKRTIQTRFIESLALIIYLSFLQPSRATTIVAIRTPAEVVIATDSAATIEGDGVPATTKTVCKIYQVNTSLFFAVSGLVNDPRTGFSVTNIVRSDCQGVDKISAKLSRIERDVQTALLRELPQVRDRDPTGYAKLSNSKGAVSVMLAGIDGGLPVATSFSLGLAASPEGSIKISILTDSCPGNCPNGVRAFWLGDGAEIDSLRADRKLPTLSMPDLARYLVQVEIDAGVPTVHGPVDVLRILPSGPIWVQRKQSCPVTKIPGVK